MRCGTVREAPLPAWYGRQATEEYPAALALWKEAKKRRAEYRNYQANECQDTFGFWPAASPTDL
jgi:hypothetical protein